MATPSYAASKEAFDKEAEELPRLSRPESFYDNVVLIQPVDAKYFSDDSKQYAIYQRTNETKYVAPYD